MASYLVDSSVLLDIFSNDPAGVEWSLDSLETAYAEGTVFLNPIVYSELKECGLVWSEIPREALFLTGKVYREYRKAGGKKRAHCRISSSAPTRQCRA